MQYPPLSTIEREMTSGRFWPGFSPPIERLYRSEAISGLRPPVVMPWLIGIFLFDMFIISDYAVAHEAIALYLVGRLVVMTPICLGLLYLAVKFRSAYDAVVNTLPVVASGTLAFLLMISHGSYRADYLFGNILILLCGCVINRSPFGYALSSVILQCVMFHIVLFGSDIVTPGGRLLHTLFCVSGAVVALTISYTLERDRRQSFLLSLRVRLLNRELESVAMTDPLTGLANRRRLAEVTERFWVKQTVAPLASIILIDLDHFKLFNDRSGHMAGDACLEAVARQVCLKLRARDLAVRFGGEEILVFLPDTDFTAARVVAEGIRSSIRAAQIPHPALGAGAIVTASLGVHSADIRNCTANELIALADTALYAAKAAGRDCIWPPMVPGRSVIEEEAAEPNNIGPREHDITRQRALA